MGAPLNERSQNILEAIVEDYIQTAEPVGSRALSKHQGIELSPATVRNVMADLEEMGFLASPHTSAGRIPTDMGYQYYIESLLQVRDLSEEFRTSLEDSSRFAGKSMEDVMQEVGNLLSGISSYTGLVMARALLRPSSVRSSSSACRRGGCWSSSFPNRVWSRTR